MININLKSGKNKWFLVIVYFKVDVADSFDSGVLI